MPLGSLVVGGKALGTRLSGVILGSRVSLLLSIGERNHNIQSLETASNRKGSRGIVKSEWTFTQGVSPQVADEMLHLSPHVTESTGVLDSGIRPLNSGFQIPNSWITDSNHLHSRFPPCGSQIPTSLFLLIFVAL